MRRWYLPLTVLGLGSVGAFLLSEQGRNVLIWLRERLQQSPDRWLEFNDNVQEELDRIQAALDRIANSIEPHAELGQ